MSDSPSQANELRLLEQKRLRGGLSPAEDARRGVLAAEAPAPRGFDVSAAAAEIRALRAREGTPGPSPASETWAPGGATTEPSQTSGEGGATTRCDADRWSRRPEGIEADAPPSRDDAALEPPQSVFTARPTTVELPPVGPAAVAAADSAGPPPAMDVAVSPAYLPEPSLGAAAIPEATGEDAAPGAAEFVPFFPGAALASDRPRDLAAAPADPPHECAEVADAAGVDAAPVYDAAAYGLDPSDPNAVAWAAWYAAQGWDPATAYAYAERMNAEAEASAPPAEPEPPALVAFDLAGSASAPGEVPAAPAEASADVLPELPSEAMLEPAAGEILEPTPDAVPRPTASLEDAIPELPAEPIEPDVVPSEEPPSGALPQRMQEESAADSIPELPPIALEALDGSEAAVPAEAMQPDVAIDLGPGFDPEPPGAALPDTAPLAESVRGDLGAAVGWEERAIPARDEPVDFSAFDAEPADARRTAMWELGDAPHEARTSGAEDPSLGIAPAGEEMPRAGLDLGPALAWHDAPATSEEPTVTGAPAQQRNAAGSLELPPLEPIELQDDDILEVGDDVVEIAEPAATLAPEPPPDAFALSGDSPDPVPTPSGLAAPDAADAAPPEPTMAFDAAASDRPFAAEPEPPALGMLSTEPEPSPSCQAEPPAPAAFVAGTHRVVLHTADGQVRRGTVVDIALDAPEVLLMPQGGGAPESIPAEQIKAIFFMLPLGQAPADPDGMRVRVTFRDGRQVAGFSADYAPERPGFFVVPADTRTHTARIWVYGSAVRQVSVS